MPFQYIEIYTPFQYIEFHTPFQYIEIHTPFQYIEIHTPFQYIELITELGCQKVKDLHYLHCSVVIWSYPWASPACILEMALTNSSLKNGMVMKVSFSDCFYFSLSKLFTYLKCFSS